MAKWGFRLGVKAGAALVVVVLLAVACQKEEKRILPDNDAKIAFNASVNKEFVSKSADGAGSGGLRTEKSHFLFSSGVDSIYLRASELRNTGQMFYVKDADSLQTKGAPIEDPTSGTTNKLAECYVSAKLNGGQPYFLDEEVLVSTGRMSPDRYWPEQPLNFFAYAPQAAKTSDWNFAALTDSNGNPVWTGSFSYSMPEPGIGENAGKDAVKLPDYIYAVATGQTKAGGDVLLTFHHAFSAICFQIGTMPANISINHIALNNIYSAGKCSYAGNASAIDFVWTDQTGQNSYMQNLNVQVNNGTAGSLEAGDAMTTNEQTFMVVPQTLPNGAAIEICFNVDGKEYTMSKEVKEITTEWKADTKYVYAISIPEGVDIEITDVVNGPKKSDLQMTNTGIATSYLRAAIVAYWIVEDGEDDSYIVEDCKADSDGKFVWGDNWDSYWIKGSDGYYYYKYQVERGDEPAMPLFEEYELTAEPPVVDAKLQMNIMVQAVIASAANDTGTWPWDASVLTSLNKSTAGQINN